ncbi:MAG TPA: hypothetical protein VEL31_32015 [Ktedonobacteraceae bacterium]|nr:hypothetical protein [Ktedonobacteraceae bacterium]
MIPTFERLDQSTLTLLREHDPLVKRYRAFFAFLDWTAIPIHLHRDHQSGPHPHPETAYIKAFLIKILEEKRYMTHLRTFLVEHPLLVLELGFRPVPDGTALYGFDVERTVPTDRWLREKLRRLDSFVLFDLLQQTVQSLQAEIAGLGEVIAIDVKHIYAWVRENNPRENIRDRFTKERQPKGDPDCRVGGKTSTNMVQPDGSTKERTEYLWGYGTGVVAATSPVYGDVVLAEYTQTFNHTDVTYHQELYQRTVLALGGYPLHQAADAAFDAWYVYQHSTLHGGIAAIPLNSRSHTSFDPDGVPRCPIGLRMHPTTSFAHTNGYRAQRYRCPLLYPEPTGQTCEHAQFAKKTGCVKDINSERGGQMRLLLDRRTPLYRAVYNQRTAAERINSQAKELGIERPKVRNGRSVARLNTLTYIVVNVRALQKARTINRELLTPKTPQPPGPGSWSLQAA